MAHTKDIVAVWVATVDLQFQLTVGLWKGKPTVRRALTVATCFSTS
jgi:hypothetical protein